MAAPLVFGAGGGLSGRPAAVSPTGATSPIFTGGAAEVQSIGALPQLATPGLSSSLQGDAAGFDTRHP